MQVFSKAKWLEPTSICMAQGASTGNVHFFETLNDHKNFLNLWEKYLGGMTDLIQYSFTSTNWMILFRTKTEADIKNAYQKQRLKSKKANPNKILTSPARMLSEHFRIWLSQYVRLANKDVGRRGTRVRSRFHKYIVNQHCDYLRIFERIHQGIQNLVQPNPEYNPPSETYDKEKKLAPWSIWRTSRLYYLFSAKKHRVVRNFALMPPENLAVLRKYLRCNNNELFITDT